MTGLLLILLFTGCANFSNRVPMAHYNSYVSSFQNPVDGPFWVSSKFGMRKFRGVTRMHKGIDLAVEMNTHIVASSAGYVCKIGNDAKGYGKYIILCHGEGTGTRYAHLSKIIVALGEIVKKGEHIAGSGNSGNSTGPHLHFEIIIHDEVVDPADYVIF